MFYALWAVSQGWTVTKLHLRMCDWLQNKGRVAVMMVFRGAGKSTIGAIYEAWKLSENPTFRFLIQSADDDTATMMTRDCRDVINRHELTEGLIKGKVSEHAFWIEGSADERNPNLRASGILSNATGGRANEVVFDDVEVPKNVESPMLRTKLRKRISEATHILLPGGTKLYIGTPHTEQSLYSELEADGADMLKIPLFEHNQRIDNAVELTELKVNIPTDDLMVFHSNKPLSYELIGDTIYFKSTSGLIDLYSGNACPERFDAKEIEFRRDECKSLNEWDSQYLLRPRSLVKSRLNPRLMKPYSDELVFVKANDSWRCSLGNTQFTGVRTYWDVSLGKIHSDDSVLSIVFQDDSGNYYWHRSAAVDGDIYSQCDQIRSFVETLKLPNIQVETSGVGGMVPAVLRKVLSGTGCSVTEKTPTGNKNKRIIDAIETPLSGGMIYAHDSVINGKAYTQMMEWNPEVQTQPDDFLDSFSGAILSSPVKIKGTGGGQERAFRPTGIINNVQYESSF